jgi:hypothetical protein
MAEETNNHQKNKSEKSASSYSMVDVFKVTDDLFQLSKQKSYHPGAFIHGLIFALELSQQSYHIPPQQLAEIKRDCRRTVHEIVATRTKTTVAEPKKEKSLP